MSTETTMHAIRQATLGGPEVLELVEVPRPSPIPTEVLVRTLAAGVNPVDWKVRARGGFLGEPPFTVGWDVAGVVEEVGYGVTRFAVGDRVFGMPRFPREAAAYAQYVTSPSRQLARLPDGLDDVEAGALPLVGHMAVQIAKARGAYVLGTARAEKHAFLADLGVDEAIDYTSENVAERAHEVDVVLDLVGGETGLDAFPAVRDGGVFVSVPSSAGLEALHELAAGRARVTGILVEPDRAGLEALAELVAAGALRPHVSQTFPLAEAGRAHELGETGRTQGKLVLTVD